MKIFEKIISGWINFKKLLLEKPLCNLQWKRQLQVLENEITSVYSIRNQSFREPNFTYFNLLLLYWSSIFCGATSSWPISTSLESEFLQ